MPNVLSLDDYRLFGRSGLRVSPLALGTMTFGEQRPLTKGLVFGGAKVAVRG